MLSCEDENKFFRAVVTWIFVIIVKLFVFLPALDCDSIIVKKQVFELLSALCVYNSDGYSRALQALEQYKVSVFFCL